MKVFLWVVFAVLVPLTLAEARECGPWLAKRLIRWSAHRLPTPEAIARYEEEWLANLQEVPGKLIPLLISLSLVLHAHRMRATLTTQKGRRKPTAELYGGLAGGLSGGLAGGLAGGLSYGLGYGLGAGVRKLFVRLRR